MSWPATEHFMVEGKTFFSRMTQYLPDRKKDLFLYDGDKKVAILHFGARSTAISCRSAWELEQVEVLEDWA